MMGDNRDNSQDSRYWGFLPREYVKGKASVRLLLIRRRRIQAFHRHPLESHPPSNSLSNRTVHVSSFSVLGSCSGSRAKTSDKDPNVNTN